MKALSREVVFSILGLAFGIGCSPTSPKLLPLPAAPPPEQVKVTNANVEFDPRVDILFVVDDSGSMGSHQQNLSNNITSFTNEIQKNKILDYHIGVLTSSMDDWPWSTSVCCGKLTGSTKFVERSTPNGMRILAQQLLVGTNGSGTEMFFDPVVAALTAPLINTWNAGFYRPDAHLAIVYITDAEDQSNSTRSAVDMYNFLVNLKNGHKERISAYGAFIPTADTSGCYRDDSSMMPTRIEEFFKLANGTSTKPNFFGLCDQQFGIKLAAVGSDLELKVGRTLLLDRLPDPSTIVVSYGSLADPKHVLIPNDYRKGWVYHSQKNAIILGENIDWTAMPIGLKLEINFDVANL